MQNEKLARCTFNSLAQQRYLKVDAKGLQFRTSQGEVYFRPISESSGKNVAELFRMPNDKRSIDISRCLLNGLFINMVSHDKTYFLLHKGARDWVRIENVRANTPPPKAAAYCRVWPLNHVEPSIRDEHWKIQAAHQVALEAAMRLHEFQMQKRVGRPPKDIQLAKIIISSYQTVASEMAALLDDK